MFHSKENLTDRFHHLVTNPILPNAEELHNKTFMGIMTCNYDFTEELLEEYLSVIDNIL